MDITENMNFAVLLLINYFQITMRNNMISLFVIASFLQLTWSYPLCKYLQMNEGRVFGVNLNSWLIVENKYLQNLSIERLFLLEVYLLENYFSSNNLLCSKLGILVTVRVLFKEHDRPGLSTSETNRCVRYNKIYIILDGIFWSLCHKFYN